MMRLTYKGSETMTEDGWIRPLYSCYSSRKIIERLAEYEDAEEQGLLVRLPVPIGTTVYEFEPLNRGVKECTERTVIKYTMYNDSIWFNFADGFMKNIEDFGNTIFLTREEAEQKLKEMENNNKVMNFNDKQVTVTMVGNSEDTAVNLIHKVMNGKYDDL